MYVKLRKLILRMSKSAIYAIIFCYSLTMAFGTESAAQRKLLSEISIDLHEGHSSLINLIKEIESVSDFTFMYAKKELAKRPVYISDGQWNMSDLLSQISGQAKVSIKRVNETIAITIDEGQSPQLTEELIADISISGKITDENGEGLPGATILEKGTTNGTTTSIDGSYQLTCAENAVLIISFVGYQTQEVTVSNRSVIDVQLSEDAEQLEEVVVIGYGEVKKSDLTGSVAAIDGKELAERQTVRLSQALQGSVPGLMVTRSGSAANNSATIRIRGITTISDSSPLIIVDGIPTASIDWINPDDVENISVLKDAASASIYGSRAASGVILITTKRAKNGQLNLDYNVEYGIETPTRLAQYADAVTYMKVLNERNWNDTGNLPGNEFPVYSENIINNYQTLHAQEPDRYPNENWQDLILNDHSTRQNHRIGLTAGNQNLKTNISLDYSLNNALYDGRKYNRLTLRANNDLTINEAISVSLDLNGISSLTSSPGRNFSPEGFGVGPVYAAMWSDGRVGEGKSGENTYALAKFGGFTDTKANTFGGRLAINVKPVEGLKLTGVVSPQLYGDQTKSFRKQIPYTSYNDPNFVAGYITGATQTNLSEYRGGFNNLTIQGLINYTKDFGRHNINLLGGFENYTYSNESLSASRQNFNLTSFPYLDLGNENYQYNSGSAYEYAYRSFFGRVMYDYDGRYLLQANLRYDASSRFADDYRWGSFPSFSAGWVISEESFMKGVSPISFLKLRASWGRLVNERIGSYYPYQSSIGFDNTIIYQGGQVVSAQSAAVLQYAIRDISWETTESFDIGLDASFFEGRLKLTGDYYKKTTKDMLLNLEVPNFIGLENPSQNTGEMYTTGWDLQLGWTDDVGELSYSVSFNISDYKSIMGDLGGTEFLGDKVKYQGSEFDEWYGYVSEGIFQTQDDVDNSAKLISNTKPGDIKYKDISGPDGEPDGVISSEYDRVLLGGSLPRYLYGGNINLKYKNFDFTIIVQGVGKQTSKMTNSMVLPFINQYIEVPQNIVGKYWSHYNTEAQNLEAQYPRVATTTSNYSASDFWLFDGSYFRMKNITLGYAIPKNISELVGIKSLRVYGSVSDLFSIDQYPEGWDPEASSYWITTSYILGAKITF